MTAFWVNPNPLSAEKMRRLRAAMPQRWSDAQRDALMAQLGRELGIAEGLNDVGITTPARVQKAQIAKVAAAARRLAASLRATGPDAMQLMVRTTIMEVLALHPGELSEATERAWHDDTVADLWRAVVGDIARISDQTADAIKPDPHDRPSEASDRRRIDAAARAVRVVRGAWPPCSQNSWFCAFCIELCDGQVADKIITTVVNEAKKK